MERYAVYIILYDTYERRYMNNFYFFQVYRWPSVRLETSPLLMKNAH